MIEPSYEKEADAKLDEAIFVGEARTLGLQLKSITWSGFHVSTIVKTSLSNLPIGAFGVNFKVYAPTSETVTEAEFPNYKLGAIIKKLNWNKY